MKNLIAILFLFISPSLYAGQSSIILDGADDFIELDPAVGVDVDLWTISVWHNPAAYPGTDNSVTVVGFNSANASGGAEIAFNERGIGASNHTVRFQAFWQTSTGQWDGDNSIYNTNTWNHTLIIYDESDVNNDPTIYVNGLERQFTEQQTPIGTQPLSTTAIRFGGNAGGNNDYNGKIGAAQMDNRLAGVWEANDLRYFPCSSGDQTRSCYFMWDSPAQDLSDNNNDLTLVNQAAASLDGPPIAIRSPML